jgi:hypothetical protein
MNIHADIQYLKSRMEQLIIEFPDLAEDEEFRADVFEGETDIERVLEKLVNMSRESETMADAIKTRQTELAERRARFDRKDEAARKLILSVMEQGGLQKFHLTEATLSLRQIAPAPIVTDPDALPDNCVRIERKPDMKAIKAELERGSTIPGTAMSNGKTSLTIRTK